MDQTLIRFLQASFLEARYCSSCNFMYMILIEERSRPRVHDVLEGTYIALYMIHKKCFIQI